MAVRNLFYDNKNQVACLPQELEHRFISEDEQSDTRIHWQVIRVHEVQKGAKNRSLRYASGDEAKLRACTINTHPIKYNRMRCTMDSGIYV